MAQTVANLTSILKQAWTSDRIQKQFFTADNILQEIQTLEATMVGGSAIVPIHKGRSGGYTSVGAAGGVLNPADAQKVDQASYTLVYHWFQLQLETGALNQASGNGLQAVIAAKDLEFEGSIDDTRNQITRQLASDGTGRIAQCATTSASATVNLQPVSTSSPSTSGLGYDAVIRGYLYPGLPVDIGTTGDSDSQVTGAVIQAVNEGPSDGSAPTITLDQTVTTSTSHYISIANPNSATAPNPELNGFRNIVSANPLGGIDPTVAGEEFWQPAYLDTTTTTLSVNLGLKLARFVHQRTGQMEGEVWTSLKQQQNWYELLQNQVRFTGDVNVGAGNMESAKFRGVLPRAIPEIYDRDWFVINTKNLRRIVGGIKEPTWATDLEGNAAQGLQWAAGTTAFKNGVVWPFQIGTQNRRQSAGATALVA